MINFCKVTLPEYTEIQYKLYTSRPLWVKYCSQFYWKPAGHDRLCCHHSHSLLGSQTQLRVSTSQSQYFLLSRDLMVSPDHWALILSPQPIIWSKNHDPWLLGFNIPILEQPTWEQVCIHFNVKLLNNKIEL